MTWKSTVLCWTRKQTFTEVKSSEDHAQLWLLCCSLWLVYIHLLKKLLLTIIMCPAWHKVHSAGVQSQLNQSPGLSTYSLPCSRIWLSLLINVRPDVNHCNDQFQKRFYSFLLIYSNHDLWNPNLRELFSFCAVSSLASNLVRPCELAC